MTALGHPALCVLLWGGAICLAAEGRGQQPDTRAADRAAIRQAAANYLAAIRQGNAEKIAACWTLEGDFLDGSGRAMNGRALAQSAAQTHRGDAAPPAISVDSLRFLASDVAIEDGTLEAAGSQAVRYTAIWVRRDGQWLLDGVRETIGEKQTARDHLQPLSWLVGEWRSEEGSTVRVESSCDWTAEKNFLLREIRVISDSGSSLKVSQRIGWDPKSQQIRVWSFDTEGGHADGVWTKEGGRWTATSQAITAEGKSARSVNAYTRLNDDTFLWESASSVDGEPLPDHKLRLVRKAPK